MCEKHLNAAHQGHHHAPHTHTHHMLNTQQKWITEHNGNCELFNDAKWWTKLAHILISSCRLFVDICRHLLSSKLTLLSVLILILIEKKNNISVAHFLCAYFFFFFLGKHIRDCVCTLPVCVWMAIIIWTEFYLNETSQFIIEPFGRRSSPVLHLTVINYLFSLFRSVAGSDYSNCGHRTNARHSQNTRMLLVLVEFSIGLAILASSWINGKRKWRTQTENMRKKQRFEFNFFFPSIRRQRTNSGIMRNRFHLCSFVQFPLFSGCSPPIRIVAQSNSLASHILYALFQLLFQQQRWSWARVASTLYTRNAYEKIDKQFRMN